MIGYFLSVLARLLHPIHQPSKATDLPREVDSATPAHVDVGHVQLLVGKVTDLTATVASDVGQHHHSVQSISSELAEVAQTNPGAIAAIVCKLLVANEKLQQRLERAELTLQTHSQQLRDAVSSARTDSLTGLLNRRALDEELSRCRQELQSRGRRAALLMLDVDHFKRFNDTFGHVIGDHALAHVARMLRAQACETDILARFGGEEFAVIFTAADAAAVRLRAEEMRSAVGQLPVVYEGSEMDVTASAGLAEIAVDETIADWLMRADAALYAAKRAGRNCGFWKTSTGLEPLSPKTGPLIWGASREGAIAKNLSNAAAELAAEAFADTSFVPGIARRIAEWRRGGDTLTVVLARVNGATTVTPAIGEGRASLPLRAAMRVARATTREMDLITRWQGDGLAFLLPSTTASDAMAFVRRLQTSLAAHKSASGENCDLAPLCVGIAQAFEGNEAKRVLERAWLALDAACQAGPGSTFAHDGLKPVEARPSPAAHCGV